MPNQKELEGNFADFRNKWIGAIDKTLSYATRLKNVRGDKLGLLGFSMGGHLAIWRAQSSRGIKITALVEFFAPIVYPPLFTGVGNNLKNLPNTLIHHGTEDGTVPIEQTILLRKLLVAAGKVEWSDFQIMTYGGEGHVFKSPVAIDSSKAATAGFFRKNLGA